MIDKHAAGLRYMIVESDLFMRNLVKNCLKSYQLHNIVEAGDVPQALEFVKRGQVDVILTDHDIGAEKGGVDLTLKVRGGEPVPNPKMPILMLSGHGDAEVRYQALNSGVNTYLVKPVSAKKIYDSILAVLEESLPPPPALSKGTRTAEARSRPAERPRDYQFGEVAVVIGEGDRALSKRLEAMFLAEGFRSVQILGSVVEIRTAILRAEVDLLVADTRLAGGDMCQLNLMLRHGLVGDNPYLLSVALIAERDEEQVKKAIGGGFDDVLLKPVTPKAVHDRVINLASNRKPFVVTTDYIGPDRRRAERKEGMVIPKVPVPNPLRMKATGGFTPERLKRDVDRTNRVINEQRIERHAYQINWLAERIAPQLQSGVIDEEALGHVKRMQLVSKDICRRISGSVHAHAAEFCMSMVSLAGQVIETAAKPDPRDLQLLTALAANIRRAISPQQ